VVCGPGRAGIDEDHVCRVEIDLRAVSENGADICGAGEIAGQSPRQLWLVFDCRYPAALTDEFCQDRRVVTDAGADMDGMLARAPRR
jgi:hypothetical protein